MEKPTHETWKELLRPAIKLVSGVEKAGYGDLDFKFGGRTVLMFRYDHRISKDIGLFIHDAQILSHMSPRLNDTAAAIAIDYQERSNFVKIMLPGGDIDIVVAGDVLSTDTSKPKETILFEQRIIVLDDTAEILAKKMLFRADTFKARDIFDMATVLDLDPEAAKRAIRATTRVKAALRNRLNALLAIDHEVLCRDIVMTDTGRPHASGMILKVLDAVERGGER